MLICLTSSVCGCAQKYKKHYYLSNKKDDLVMKLKLWLTALLFAFSINCFAAPASKATIEELFQVTQAQKIMDTIYGQMDGMFKKMVEGMNVPEEQKPVIDRFFVKYNALVKEDLGWEKLKDPMIDAYANVYTEAEVKDMIKFYKSSAGKKMLAKMPELMQATMGIVQGAMKDMMPKVNQLQSELREELKQANTKQQ